MASLTAGPHKYACSICARRKIKCDKGDPCSNCSKAQAQCLYEEHPPPRPRKRAADEDLLARLGAYEELLREHNIDFTHCAHTWVQSDLQSQLKLSTSSSTSPTSITGKNALVASKGWLPDDSSTNWERCLWSNLAPELKSPPAYALRYHEDPYLHPIQPLHNALSTSGPPLHQLHPEPRQIYRLWQDFVERVNPLIKIVHIPTLQQRILDASWDLGNISAPLAAVMFSIYNLAVVSLSSTECYSAYGETRSTLIARYRTAALWALVAADFLVSRDLEVLQAFALFLLADPESELTSSLTCTAVRIGQKMGLNRPNHPKIPFFENEMRIRLWWQLNALDSRACKGHNPGMRPQALVEFGDMRLPLNVNDADLHPEMTEPPTEHVGPTEMICVLVKFQVFQWIRHSGVSLRVFENITDGPEKSKMSRDTEDRFIDKLESIYKENFLRHLDLSIPLHALSHAVAILGTSRLRYKAHHPRMRAVVHDGVAYMDKEESNMAFHSAVTSMEMLHIGEQSKYSRHLFTHIALSFQLETNIYIISELRRRVSGERVEMAWKLIESMFNEFEQLINDEGNSFFIRMGDLTLEAWEARAKHLIREQRIVESGSSPPFIDALVNKRQARSVQNMHVLTGVDSQGLGTFDVADVHDIEFDWESWSCFWRL